ncbi:MAG: hypothetical protein JJU41_02085 [Bacteroidetes bacterium]|nr:hypothetical protein [Bacteroidota bacterium]MCH8523852.1 energy transducer TonB [Balneolales bacterium]
MKKSYPENIPYNNRVNYSLAIILLAFSILFRFFPTEWTYNHEISDFNINDEHQITLIDITRQEATAAIPPRPRIRLNIEYTTTEIIEPDVELLVDISLEVGEVLPLPRGNAENSDISATPQRTARVFRIVEPVTPPRVIQEGQRYRVYVSFIIDVNGAIEDVFVNEIQQFDSRLQQFKTTQESQQDIVEATLEAAVQWRFRPAENNGTPVRSISTHLFTFGR